MTWLQLAFLVLTGPFVSRLEAGIAPKVSNQDAPSDIESSASPSSSTLSAATSSSIGSAPSASLAAQDGGKQCFGCTLAALNPGTLTLPISYTPPANVSQVTQTVVLELYYSDGTLVSSTLETIDVTLASDTTLYSPPSWSTFGTWL